jgi:hypothetical protein
MYKKDRTDSMLANQAFNNLTKDGREWIKTALDPFHDNSLVPQGYPDANGAPSATVLYTSSMQLSGTGSGNWDAGVAIYPFISSVDVTFRGATSDPLPNITYRSNSVGDNIKLGSVHVARANEGDPVFIAGISAGNAGYNSYALHAEPLDRKGHVARVVAAGVEVTNTTAEIYKQGTVTTAVIPQWSSLSSALLTDLDAVHAPFGGACMVHLLPGSKDECTQFPNSRQWAASQGCYMTALMNDVYNPAKPASCGFHFLARSADMSAAANKGIINVLNGDDDPFLDGMRPSNLSTSVAYFTGLSQETTLNIVSRFYVEYFPQYDASLLSVASPSPPYDPMALELYSNIIRYLPPAVPVAQNAKGDWWRNIAGIVADVAPSLGLVAEAVVPGASRVGSMVGSVASGVSQIPRRKNKPAKKPPPIRRQPAGSAQGGRFREPTRRS